MPFCRSCGGKSPEDALFCPHCGHRLQPPAEEVTSVSDPHTAQVTRTPPPETPTLTSTPLQAVPINDGEEEEEKRRVIPPVVPPELPATGNVPSVQGTPQVGTVPSVPGLGGSAATTLTAGTMAKVIVIAATCAAVIFAGIKVLPPIFLHPPATPTTSVTHAKATTVPMPSTQTSCPAQGTARAAVTALLVLGTHQNLVYSTRLGAISNATSYTLKRYDTTTGQTTEIVKLDNTEISNAQISTDGQWVLFTSTVNGQAAIQMIRMDGQGLQTLYCNPVKPDPTNSFPASISSIAWSVDQKLAMFSESDNSNNPPTLYLLNLANGTVQKELLPDSASSTIYYPTLWIDATHVALSASDLSGTSGQSIYVLDISKGANQQSVSLQLIVKATTSCLNFDINPAHTKFFLSRCTMDRSLPNFNAQGPSSISVLPVTGGSEQTIFTTQTLGVTGIRVISNTELLVLITTKGFSSGIDSSKNGLYKMHVDGTHLTQLIGNDLIGNDGHQFVSLNGPSATWSIVSRDGRMYALEIAWCGNACTYTLLFGSLSGGKPTTIISGNSINGNASTLVGWTTM